MTTAPQIEIGGEVASGFEGVRDAFAQNAADAGDGGFAYAVYRDGKKVVDLWTGKGVGDEPWGPTTLAQWMSTTKAVTAFCMQILTDRGKLDIDAPIASFWPEFAANGKEKITTADVMTHRSGVVGSPAITALVDLNDGTGIDQTDQILALLAEATPAWEPGTATGYHTLSYGWLLDGVIRHVDGRDLGAFFRQEVAEPLGLELWIGAPASVHDRISTIHAMMFPDAMPDLVRDYMNSILEVARDPSTPAGASCLARDGQSVLDRVHAIFNTAHGRTPPMGGSNLTGTAADVACLFGAMAKPDDVDGVKLSSLEARDRFSEIQTEDEDVVLKAPIPKALGYWRNKSVGGRPQVFGANEETFGHTGFGGQIGFADPVANLGVAFTRSHYTAFGYVPLFLNAALYAALA